MQIVHLVNDLSWPNNLTKNLADSADLQLGMILAEFEENPMSAATISSTDNSQYCKYTNTLSSRLDDLNLKILWILSRRDPQISLAFLVPYNNLIISHT